MSSDTDSFGCKSVEMLRSRVRIAYHHEDTKQRKQINIACCFRCAVCEDSSREKARHRWISESVPPTALNGTSRMPIHGLTRVQMTSERTLFDYFQLITFSRKRTAVSMATAERAGGNDTERERSVCVYVYVWGGQQTQT